MNRVCNYLFVISLFIILAPVLALEDTRDFKQGESLYVHSLHGLNMREAPSATSKSIASMGHGRQAVVSENLNKDNKYTYDNIKGYWVKIKFDRKEGFIFSGFASKFPSPKSDAMKEYAEMLKQSGVDGSYKTTNNTEESISLANTNLLDCYLVSRKLFDVSDSLKWPAMLVGVRTIVTDPKKPLSVLNRTLEIVKEDSGQIKELIYIDKSSDRERTSVLSLLSETSCKMTTSVRKTGEGKVLETIIPKEIKPEPAPEAKPETSPVQDPATEKSLY